MSDTLYILRTRSGKLAAVRAYDMTIAETLLRLETGEEPASCRAGTWFDVNEHVTIRINLG